MRDLWFFNSFHIEIFLIELLFCARCEKRSWFPLRLLLLGGSYCGLPFLIPEMYFASFFVVGWFTFGFLVMIIISGIVLFSLFRLTVKQVIFYTCVAHTVQHIGYNLHRLAFMKLGLSFRTSQILMAPCLALLAVVVYLILDAQFRKGAVDLKNTHLAAFAIGSSLCVYVLNYWTVSQEAETAGVLLFDIFSCMLMLFILFALFEESRARQNESIMLHLLRQEQMQHAMNRETVDTINRKCHDMKHQISALRTMSREQQDRSISELEKEILIYDRFAKTGNENLDLVLAEKSLLCEKQGISIQCMVDGKRLSFMDTEDLFVLFGNALDNAIASASREELKGRRIISLRTLSRPDSLTVHIENPCREAPTFTEGIPVTIKEDRDYHGFGVRSMRHVAEKYGGVLSASWEDGFFCLDILFPGRE